MMEIIDKSTCAPVTGYAIGDLIQDGASAYMIARSVNGNYYVVDLGKGAASDGYASLKELYHETHASGERKVKAAVVIEGKAPDTEGE
ncbi:hypothetical protein ACEPPO_00765 (plasmid) [Limosilactobacillus fermentum]